MIISNCPYCKTNNNVEFTEVHVNDVHGQALECGLCGLRSKATSYDDEVSMTEWNSMVYMLSKFSKTDDENIALKNQVEDLLEELSEYRDSIAYHQETINKLAAQKLQLENDLEIAKDILGGGF